MLNDHDDGMVAHTEVCRHKQTEGCTQTIINSYGVLLYIAVGVACWLILLIVLVLTSTAVSSSRYLGGKEKGLTILFCSAFYFAQFAWVTVLATGHGYICSSKKSLTAYKNCEINMSLESHLLVLVIFRMNE